MVRKAKIYVAGHQGLVGSAILRRLKDQGYSDILLRPREALDLCDQAEVYHFFAREKMCIRDRAHITSRWIFIDLGR